VLSRPVTRRQRGIIQKKVRTDGTVAWNTVMSTRSASIDTFEPVDYRTTLCIPHWREAIEK
jgi:hypothetical protein